jgi:hypothetical protein
MCVTSTLSRNHSGESPPPSCSISILDSLPNRGVVTVNTSVCPPSKLGVLFARRSCPDDCKSRAHTHEQGKRVSPGQTRSAAQRRKKM